MIAQDKKTLVDYLKFLTKEYEEKLEEGMFMLKIEIQPFLKNNVTAIIDTDKKWSEMNKPVIATGDANGQPNV